MLAHACIFPFWDVSLLLMRLFTLSFFDTFDWDTVLLLRRMHSMFSKHLGVVIGCGRNMWCGGDFRSDLVVHGRCGVCHLMVHSRCRCNHRFVVHHRCRCNHCIVVHNSRWRYTVGKTVGDVHHGRVHGLTTFGTLLVSILLISRGSRMVKWVQLCILEAVAIGQTWMVGVRLGVVERSILITVVTSFGSTVVTTSVRVAVVGSFGAELVPFVRVSQALVMALVLGFEDIVFVLVGRLSASRLNLDRSIMLAIMHGLELIWLHLEHQVPIISIGLRGTEGG